MLILYYNAHCQYNIATKTNLDSRSTIFLGNGHFLNPALNFRIIFYLILIIWKR